MKKKILVVDDDAIVREVIRKAMERAGHEVIESADGGSIAELFVRERADLVLLDLHMPGLDGLEALSEILDADPGAAVIVITGDGDEKHAKLALERGARDFLTKPFEIQSLELSVAANLLAKG